MTRRGQALASAAVATMVALAGVAQGVRPAQAAEGPLHAYIIDARTPASTARAASAVARAGGQVVQSWPQIGVVVAQSRRTNFLTALQNQHNPAVLMAADSRNQEVAEGAATPGSATVAASGSGRTGTTKRLTGRVDNMEGRQSYLRQTGALAAQARTEGNSRVVVGVLDTGVDGTHPDLRQNFDAADSVNCTAGGRPDTTAGHWIGTDHGTHVAGIIGAAQQGWGIQGVAPHVRLASVKVISGNDTTWPEFLVCGFMWSALHHLNVTNSSYTVHDLWCDQMHLAPAGRIAVGRAISYATRNGVAHVQAAGNDGLDLTSQLGGACSDPLMNRRDVMQVSAVDASNHLLEFSNTGMGQVDIAAPGLDLFSTLPRDRYGRLTGTSQAAPQVSGALALLASEHPGATPAQLIAGLQARATRVSCRRSDFGCTTRGRLTSYYGAGVVNVRAAIVPTRGTTAVPLLPFR